MSILIEKKCMNAVHNTYSIIEDKVLCGYSKSRELLESKISLPTLNVVAAYLLSTFTRSAHIDIMKWKMSFNDVILTREFKPHMEKPINDEYMQSVFVYDVTKIISGNEVSFRISCNAKGYVYLNGVTLLAILNYKGFHTHMLCEVNPYTMNSSETKKFDVPLSFETNESAIHLGLISDNVKLIEVHIDNNIAKRVNISRGYNVIEITTNQSIINAVRIDSKETNLRHVFSCAEFRQTKHPKIIVEGLSISSNTIGLRLRNIGDGTSDSLELIVLRYGVPIYRTSLPTLKPGELIAHEIALDSISKHTGLKVNNMTLRIIWSKAYKLFEHDIPIKIPLGT